MNSRKHSLFVFINALLGLVTCFGFLYTWLAFAFMESLLSLPTVLSLLISVLLFIGWNVFMLRNERKKYWIQALFSYVATIGVFIYFLN
ncbi:hypothetical protein [Thalassobacillus hwangdonensis]|uniref:DUF3953 domain-containing protein n=1 Tax=Thalassobacillus hwangdonensis TaxID=546108 RepID=A0ABW3L0K0_9BACI